MSEEIRRAADTLRSERWPSGPLWSPLADWLEGVAQAHERSRARLSEMYGEGHVDSLAPDLNAHAIRVARVINAGGA